MVATTTTMTSTTVTNIFSTIKTKYTSIPIQNILTHINSISAVTNYCRYRIPSLQITAISCYSLPIWHHYYCPSDSHGISSTVIFFTLAISTADAMSNIQISFWFEINSPRCPIQIPASLCINFRFYRTHLVVVFVVVFVFVVVVVVVIVVPLIYTVCDLFMYN